MNTTRQLAIQRAASEDAILALGVVSAIRHFGMIHADVLAARDMAISTWPKERIKDVLGRNRQNRRYHALAKYERKYPMIFRQTLVNGDPYRAVSERTKIARQVVGRMVLDFKKYAEDYGISVAQLMESVETDARKYGQ